MGSTLAEQQPQSAAMQAQGYHIKQVPPRTPENMTRLQGDVTQQIALKILTNIPKFPSGSVVHDNACGNGVFTQTIMETQDVAAINKIHVTDILSAMCEATQQKVEKGPPGWAAKVETEVMPSENLKFADETFTHSFAGFVLHAAQDSGKIASEMYRTMKSHGASVGYITVWGGTPHHEALLKAHASTRPADSKHFLASKVEWQDPAFVRKELEKAGFAVEITKLDAVLSIEDTIKWSELAWGLTGAPIGGWRKEDEDRFDEAVEVFAKDLQASKQFTPNGKGGGQLKMVAIVATVRKK